MAEEWIRICFLQHAKTGLVAAISDDLKGLLVTGRSFAEVESKLPAAIAELATAKAEG